MDTSVLHIAEHLYILIYEQNYIYIFFLSIDNYFLSAWLYRPM